MTLTNCYMKRTNLFYRPIAPALPLRHLLLRLASLLQQHLIGYHLQHTSYYYATNTAMPGACPMVSIPGMPAMIRKPRGAFT